MDKDGFYSDKDAWHVTYQKDIMNPKISLAKYALFSPSEGFAELYRVLHEKGEEAVKFAFPNCHKFLETEKLL